MRKVVASLLISLDGVVESPERWVFDAFDADMGAAMSSIIGAQGTVLLGRRTYEEWSRHWPTSKDEPYASFINGVPKIVFASAPLSVDWKNAELARSDLASTVAELRRRPGKDIGTQGSPTLVHALLEQGLLDELRLQVFPVVAGAGRRLFRDGSRAQRLALAESKTTSTGVALLTYRPR